MRIVEINTVCDTGSTGRIAAGVARIAKQRGHEAFFAYGRGKHPADIQGYKIGNKGDFVIHVLLNFLRGKSGFGSLRVTKKFLRWLDIIHPDVLHLHNLHGFYINVELLFEYIKERNIPVVWTLHDCWPFTGQCAHFDYVGCNKWRTGCYNCPIYRTEYPYSLFCDNSKGNYDKKRGIFSGVNTLTIVTPSEWLSSLVKESFLKNYKIQIINNGIDLIRFRVMNPDDGTLERLRVRYSIKKDRRIVLGVANVWTERKGLDSFYQLANNLPMEYLIILVGIKGRVARTIRSGYANRIIGIERTESIDELVCWYNIADVFVNPTLEDNFPTTNIEALACGTPIITYNTGGSPESVDSQCGIVVNKGDIIGLLNAVDSLSGRKKEMSHICRQKAIQQYDGKKQLAQYIDLMKDDLA